MKIYNSIDQLIGATPLIRLSRVEERFGLKCRLLAKLEYLNPTGSVKDRAALTMLDEAAARGEINEKSVIIEPTSGNTGIGLAAIAAARGMRAIIVMPDTMSRERRVMMAAYGAEVVLTPGAEGMSGAIKKAEELAKKIPYSFIPAQFDNKDNKLAHIKTTGPEIYEDTDGEVDVFVAGIGTGGTLSGVAEYLKSKKPCVHTVGIEPAESPLITRGEAHPHALQGIGANFIPSVLNLDVVDEVLTVTKDEAYGTVRMLGATEGIAVGISAGAALFSAIEVARRKEYEGKTVVVLLPDGMDRYLSTDLY